METAYNLLPHIQIDSTTNQYSSGPHEARDTHKSCARISRLHVDQKIIRQDDVAAPEFRRKSRVAGIALDTLRSPSDCVLHAKNLAIRFEQSMKVLIVNRPAELHVIPQITGQAGSLESSFGNVDAEGNNVQIWPSLSKQPKKRIELRPRAARHGANPNRGA